MESAQQSDGAKSSTKYIWVAIAVFVFVFVIYIVSALTSNTFVADIRDGGVLVYKSGKLPALGAAVSGDYISEGATIEDIDGNAGEFTLSDPASQDAATDVVISFTNPETPVENAANEPDEP
jgi:hypothetical protein